MRVHKSVAGLKLAVYYTHVVNCCIIFHYNFSTFCNNNSCHLSLSCDLHAGRTMVVILFKSRSNLIQKSIWVQPRSKDWWNFVTSSSSDSNWWHGNLCMSRSTFNYFCSQLSPYIQNQNTQIHDYVPVEQQVALTLWRLATNADFCSIS